jgi:octaprenyl-diphosphate synthase
VTLPIIHLYQKAGEEERRFLEHVTASKEFTEDNKASIMDLVRSYGTVEDSRKLANEYASRAQDLLSGFPASVYREALVELPQLVINRKN